MSLNISVKSKDQATTFKLTRDDEDEVSISVVGIAEFEITLDFGAASGQYKTIKRGGTINECVSIVNGESIGCSNGAHTNASVALKTEDADRSRLSPKNAANAEPISSVPIPVGNVHQVTPAKSPASAPAQAHQHPTPNTYTTKLDQHTTNLEDPFVVTKHHLNDNPTGESVATAPQTSSVVGDNESILVVVPTDTTNSSGVTSRTSVTAATSQQIGSTIHNAIPCSLTSSTIRPAVQTDTQSPFSSKVASTNQTNTTTPLFSRTSSGPSFTSVSTPEPWVWPTQASSAWAFPSAHQQGTTPTNQGSFLFSGFPLSSFNNFHASGSSHLSGPTTSQSLEPTNGSVYLGQALRPWSGPTGFNNAPNPVIPLERPFVPKGFRNEVGVTEVMESIGAIEPYCKFSHEELRDNYYKSRGVVSQSGL